MSSLAISFTGKNRAAQTAVDAYIRRYTWRIAEGTRAAIKSIIERSIREGIAPYDAAKLVRRILGLSAPQANAVMNYREQVKGTGLDAAGQEKAVAKYSEKLLKARALTIARTEIMGALNAGSQATWEDARDAGLLTNPMKTWILTPDELLCPICEALGGETVPLDASFSGGLDQPPAHPNCRCTAAVVEGGKAKAGPGPAPVAVPPPNTQAPIVV